MKGLRSKSGIFIWFFCLVMHLGILVLPDIASAVVVYDEPPDSRLVIERVRVDYNRGLVFIYGKNLNGDNPPPFVTLSGTELVVTSYTLNEIVAILPKDIQEGFHHLSVSTGHALKQNDVYGLHIAYASQGGLWNSEEASAWRVRQED